MHKPKHKRPMTRERRDFLLTVIFYIIIFAIALIPITMAADAQKLQCSQKSECDSDTILVVSSSGRDDVLDSKKEKTNVGRFDLQDVREQQEIETEEAEASPEPKYETQKVNYDKARAKVARLLAIDDFAEPVIESLNAIEEVSADETETDEVITDEVATDEVETDESETNESEEGEAEEAELNEDSETEDVQYEELDSTYDYSVGDGNVVNSAAAAVLREHPIWNGPFGGKETYYNPDSPGLAGLQSIVDYMHQLGFTGSVSVSPDGVYLWNGYVMVAAGENYPRGTFVTTSLGPAMVCDCCVEYTGTNHLDICVSWW